MMRGSRSYGKMRSVPSFVAVDGERDALVQERAVGGRLPRLELGTGTRGAGRKRARTCRAGDPASSNISS